MSSYCLLSGDKFMPEMHLIEHRFMYSVYRGYTRHKEKVKNLMKQEIYYMFNKMNEIKLTFNEA